MTSYQWTGGIGRVVLTLNLHQAESASHPGPCDADVAALMQEPSISRQLAALDPDDVRAELREYGAWDDEELSDHRYNLARILWIACCDVSEWPEEFIS